MAEEKISTGIKGLDEILFGGIPKGHVVLITGGAGTGKTTFQSQFIWDKLKKGEKCLFITLEETPEEIKGDALQYGFDFSEYEKNNKFKIEYFDPFELSDMSHRLYDLITVNEYKYVAIDSIALLGMYVNDEYKIRTKLFKIIQALKKSGATTIISTEIPEGSGGKLSRYGVEEFVVDGVIVLTYLNVGEDSFGNIEVRKMRRTQHKHGVYPIKITEKGIIVNSSSM